MFLIILSFLFFPPANQNDCISIEEKKLHEMINAYRIEKELPPIPLSSDLSLVARSHARDLAENYNFDPENKCNPHSWSDKGDWTSCCYTSNHAEAECMWKKPMEIADYPGYGYEIAYYQSSGANPTMALSGWKSSKSHNPIIVNQGMWKQVEWKAMGVGIFKEYAVVWFGEIKDPTVPVICEGNQ